MAKSKPYNRSILLDFANKPCSEGKIIYKQNANLQPGLFLSCQHTRSVEAV